MNMVLKFVSKNVVDVFTGPSGWDNWSRFQKTAKGPKLVSGAGVTQPEYQEVKNALYQNKAA